MNYIYIYIKFRINHISIKNEIVEIEKNIFITITFSELKKYLVFNSIIILLI